MHAREHLLIITPTRKAKYKIYHVLDMQVYRVSGFLRFSRACRFMGWGLGTVVQGTHRDGWLCCVLLAHPAQESREYIFSVGKRLWFERQSLRDERGGNGDDKADDAHHHQQFLSTFFMVGLQEYYCCTAWLRNEVTHSPIQWTHTFTPREGDRDTHQHSVSSWLLYHLEDHEGTLRRRIHCLILLCTLYTPHPARKIYSVLRNFYPPKSAGCVFFQFLPVRVFSIS